MSTNRIGFLGLGLMGSRMAARLLDQGFELTVWNRSPGKDEELVARGAERAAGPRSVGEACDLVVTMLADDDAVHDVVLGTAGLAEGMGETGCLVEMSTTSIRGTLELTRALDARGIGLVDAPVFGSTSVAGSGDLVTVVGAGDEHLERARPVLHALTKDLFHAGFPPAGTAMKLAGNLLGAGTTALVGEAISLVEGAGLDARRWLEVMGATSLNSQAVHARGATMLEGRFDPGWPVRHVVKDVTLAHDAAEEFGLTLRTAEGVGAGYAAALDRGFGDEDAAAVVKAVGDAEGTA